MTDTRVTFISVDSSGNVLGFSQVDPSVVSAHATACPGAIQLDAAQAAALAASPGPWTYSSGVVSASEPPLATLQSIAKKQVDTSAEAARLRWITPGAGQALEYMQSQAEADAAAIASDPLDPGLYPLLSAEVSANVAAGNTTVTLRQVATAAAAQVTAWRSAGAAIKQARLTAKLRIAAATTKAQIDSIVASLTWPAPS